jgi:hypothetical protein
VGGCPDALQVAAGTGFGHREGAEQLAPGERRQPALLLVLGGQVEQVGQHEVVLQPQCHVERRGPDPGGLLVDDHPVAVVGLAGAAVLLGHREAVDALRRGGPEDLGIDQLGLLPVQEVGGDLAGEELAHGLPVLLVVVGVERTSHGWAVPSQVGVRPESVRTGCAGIGTGCV